MTHQTRRRPSLGVVVMAAGMVVAACSAGSASPSASTPAGPSAASPTTSSAAPSASPTPAPLTSASASAASVCAVTPQTTKLPSDRLLDFTAVPGGTSDTLTFAFGNPSLPGPAAPPKGTLDVTRPPYTVVGSDRPLQMVGDRVVTVRYTGMSLQNDTGQPTYVGPRGIEEGFPSLRHAVVYDESEGVIAWYVGFDGPGCVTMARAGNTVVVTIDHD